MKNLEARMIDDQRRVEEYQRRHSSDFGETKFDDMGMDAEGHHVVRMSNNQTTVVRKEHNTPEYLRKEGD